MALMLTSCARVGASGIVAANISAAASTCPPASPVGLAPPLHLQQRPGSLAPSSSGQPARGRLLQTGRGALRTTLAGVSVSVAAGSSLRSRDLYGSISSGNCMDPNGGAGGGCSSGGAIGWCPPGVVTQGGPRRRRVASPAPSRSSTANGQVGPPPARKPHKGGGGGKEGDKVAAGHGSAAPAAVTMAPSSAAPLTEAVGTAAGGEGVHLEELDEEAGQQLAPYMDAVVKVYCMHTEPNYSLPWQRKRQYSSSSSGFVVRYSGRNWLLTNAHSVDYHTQVKVKRRGDDRKFLARVISVGVDCDIAALEVDDPEFWGAAPAANQDAGPAAATAGPGNGASSAGGTEGSAVGGEARGPPPVLELGPLPRLQDGVAVVGYPIGGDTISVTAGVVSRIEVTDYSHGSTDLLAIQIDAAINGGNSGGPVFNRACQCVGIAFQALVGSDVENVGYVIPTPVVAHFLEDYLRSGTFSGFPALGLQWQRMESDALRRAYGMSPGQKGVLVRSVNPTSTAGQLLQPDDVLLSFDGTPISNDGTVPFRTGERIAFSYLITSKFVGDTARLDVLRGGHKKELTVTLSKPTALVPPHLSNRDPPYLIVGGLVFTTASEPYLQSEYGSDYGSDAPVKLLDRLYHGFPKTADEEVVVLSQVLACDATLGYEEVYNVQLLRFNGEPVSNLAQVARSVRQALQKEQAAEAAGGAGGFLRFDLDYNEVVVVEARDVLKMTPEVMRAHSIPCDMSPDLRAALAASEENVGVGVSVSSASGLLAVGDGGRA
ncbi:hypothetical protein VaNZ11_001910 [Volvox africanus]|uniref:Protease Do-like PDZ domain-containing protein n=1 Tax=Volvox africanus TaxID=51714 RepID=A0ABQ5RS27_9CHLO|nr:hypothetical protein VaNZ11_001910 [Volvox africanus]